MATPQDDNKVFDVAKPGKAKASPTSRPIIVGRSGPPVKDPTLVHDDDQQSELALTAPSVARKIIAPLDAPDAATPVAAVESPAAEPITETDIAVPADVPPAAAAAPTDTSLQTQESDAVAAPLANVPKPAEMPKPEPVEMPSAATGNTTSSGAAEVNALADTVNTKSEEVKKAEAEIKMLEEVNVLVASKKYYVPLAHDSTRRRGNKKPLLVLLVLLLLLTGAYLVVDAGIIELPGYDVPYHFIGR